MDLLPSEILSEIFEYLSNEDIINLPHRTVARGLSESQAIDYFEREIQLVLDEQSLQRLLRISKHITIAQTVTKLAITFTTSDRVDLISAKPQSNVTERLEGILTRILTLALSSLPCIQTFSFDGHNLPNRLVRALKNAS